MDSMTGHKPWSEIKRNEIKRREVSALWLPEGDHWGLRISHDPVVTGSFTGGDWKLVWHTTEGSGLEGARSTLHANGDEPHFLIDPSKTPAPCVQMIALNQFGKALAHPGGTPETNRANCIQVEIVGFASASGLWGDARYQRLASLVALVEHRINIDRNAYHDFAGPRISPDGWKFAQ